MKVALLVFAAIIASAVGNAVEKPDYGKPCELKDLTCCKSKLEIFIRLIVEVIGKNLVIEKLEVKQKYGCCDVNILLTELRIQVDKLVIIDFDIDLKNKKIKIILKDSEAIGSSGFEIIAKCGDLPIYLKDKSKFKLTNLTVELDLTYRINKGGLLRIIGATVKPSLQAISFELENKKLEKLFNDIPLNGLLVILKEVIKEINCIVGKIVYDTLKKITGLSLADLFIV